MLYQSFSENVTRTFFISLVAKIQKAVLNVELRGRMLGADPSVLAVIARGRLSITFNTSQSIIALWPLPHYTA